MVAIAVGAAIGLAIACDFPNPALVIIDPGPTGEGGSPDGPATPAPHDAGTEPDVEAKPIPGAYDGSPDAIVIVQDAGNPIDASGCVTCDCDQDLFERPDCGAAPVKDCDDNDPRYAPDQGFLDIPRCGEEGTYVFCVTTGALGLECSVDQSRISPRRQACQ
jgi:hypothetical protein